MRGLRANMRASHERSGAPRRQAWLTTALAPMMRRRRSDRSPIFEMAPSRCLPPVDFCKGVRPSQAAKSRPGPCCTDPTGGVRNRFNVGGFPDLTPDIHLAVQAEPGPPSPHSEAEAQGDEL